ncbi:MAG TPA: (2Fe-2S)-binding protein [bacterium]|nr:(2Fe-2S)-binding protein [bacterium]
MPTAAVSTEPLHAVTVTVNGRAETLHVPARRSLLQALREDLSLTGTKEGCAVGTCGACTVLLDGRPVLACLLLTVQAGGRAVETIESLSRDGALAPIQEAFVRHDALQCGFCTPGQIMALEGLLRRTPHPSDELLRRALEGNVCRCGTQLRIQAAARELAGAAAHHPGGGPVAAEAARDRTSSHDVRRSR